MTDPRSDLIDGALEATELRIAALHELLTRSRYLVLWYDHEDGQLNDEVGYRRAQVLMEVPDEVGSYAIYKLVDGAWHVDSSSEAADAGEMLGQFLAMAADADTEARHPCRQLTLAR